MINGKPILFHYKTWFARVDRKRRTRGLEAAHAWTGSGARVNWKRRTRGPDNGCRTGLPPRH